MNAKIDFSKISFLIVDGDKISAQVVYDTLAYLGASHIQRVKTPNDAFDVLRREQIDIVVCEWRLRGMDGLEFLDVMRNSTNSPNRFIPVIMLTAHSEMKYVTTARDLGITEFLAKPFNAKALYSRSSRDHDVSLIPERILVPIGAVDRYNSTALTEGNCNG